MKIALGDDEWDDKIINLLIEYGADVSPNHDG